MRKKFQKKAKKTKKEIREIRKRHSSDRQNKRLKTKIQCIEYLGGKCQNCGYDKSYGALDFHHKNPSEKDFCITGDKSFEILKPELDKCILLCANCHRELHYPHLIK